MLLCRLDGLPDLNQSVPAVAQQLVAWGAQMVRNYSFDGLRVGLAPPRAP